MKEMLHVPTKGYIFSLKVKEDIFGSRSEDMSE